MKKKRRLCFFIILFIVPFLIRLIWAFNLAPVPYLYPDEFIYPRLGKLYVEGLASGNLSVFKVNISHPPLSKLITALFTSFFGPLGFSDLYALRLQGCFFSSFTCILGYCIGSLASRRVGILSWFLLSFDPLSIRFALATLDVTSLFFAIISIYTLFNALNHQNPLRLYLTSGIFLGLAGLCKYFAFPIVLGVLSLIMLREKVSLKISVMRITIIVILSMAILILGNPLFWPPQILGFSGYHVFLNTRLPHTMGPEGSVLTPFDWIEPTILAWNTPFTIFYLSMFSLSALIYPLPLFTSSYLAWLFMISIFYSIKKKEKIIGLSLRNLLWFSTVFLFFWLFVKSQVVPYYSVWLQPPMAIFSATIIGHEWRKIRL